MSHHDEQLSFLDEQSAADNSPVICLGMTFENEEARRRYFREELRKKLPELKNIEGFPIGEDEDIIALSDPPYYTACPNPWINDFIVEWEKEKVTKYGRNPEEKYHREPFAADVSEGKSDPIYKAHSYHTKVPHKAIMKYILHYTKPGDIIFDGFGGTGMTGVAARECDLLNEKDRRKIISEIGNVEFGPRNVILNELSPAATFIQQGYNLKANARTFELEATRLIWDIEKKYGWMYKTLHTDGQYYAVNYFVWSDVYLCPYCTQEIIYWNEAISHEKGEILKKFNCSNCGTELEKKVLERAWIKSNEIIPNRFDNTVKKQLVEINYNVGSKSFKKKPDINDFEVLEKIKDLQINKWIPANPLLKGDKTMEPINVGITNIDLFFTKRNLISTSEIWEVCEDNKTKFLFTSLITRLSKLSNLHISNYFNGGGGAASGNMKGILHPPTISLEQNPFKYWPIRIQAIKNVIKDVQSCLISNSSSTDLRNIPDESVDYIFIDPPFGANLSYSDLNTIWEGWLKIQTNIQDEAIVNKTHMKTLNEYQELITQCLIEHYRILKPDRWITVEFSNTKASVWTSLQQAIERAGFVVANVAVLDKKQGGYNANVHAVAVKKDLAITAYKPAKDIFTDISHINQTENNIWEFVSMHLSKLPTYLISNSEINIVVERTTRALFDRMVAFYVQNGLQVPMSSAEFQSKIERKFPMRDGMVFLEEQIIEYDKYRLKNSELKQMNLLISDEETAIDWLRQKLVFKPQTRQDLHPQFMKEIQHISKHEQLPELDSLLLQNFLRYEGDEVVPDQIGSYLRRNYHDFRGLENSDKKMKDKALNRWYVPNPNKQADLEKLREKSLLREFDSYVEELGTHKKKLKQFRTEAIRAGFKKAWSDKDYAKIVTVGDRLPESVIQEDDKLLMYYDNAQIRLDM